MPVEDADVKPFLGVQDANVGKAFVIIADSLV
jgi:hypothetical protein